MLKKINKVMNFSIISSILLIILGIVILLMPNTSLKVFSIIVAALLLLKGTYLVILDFKNRDNIFIVDTLFSGIIYIILGIILLIKPSALTVFIPIVLGILFIVTSIFKIRMSLYLRKTDNSFWILTLIMAILSILCGFILILDPISSSITIAIFIGIVIIIYAISDLIDMIIFKKNINKISKFFKEI